MPRRSPFSIVLSKEERAILETQVRQYTSPYCDVIRAKIVLLAAEELSNDVIAARLDTPTRLSANGASDLLSRGFPASRHSLGAGDPPTFPPASSSR